MTNSTRLALPFIDAAQSQKHVTHNEALVALDALVHLSVTARGVTAPPATPAEGDRYLVGAGATGAFADAANAIAAFDDGGWALLAPRAGWRVFVASENLFLVFDGTGWNDIGLSLKTMQALSRLGVGANADAGNPFTAKLNGALFTARATGEGGSGDLRLTLNKSAAANTVSQLYQTDYSGRAETGLAGDDHFRIKVSPDGSTWREAVNVDPTSGVVFFQNGVVHNNPGFRNRIVNGNFDVWQRGTSFSVASNADTYTADRWKFLPYNSGVAVTVSRIAAPAGFRGASAINAQGTGVAASSSLVFSQRLESQMVADLDGKPCVVSFDCVASTSAGSLNAVWFLSANTAVDNGSFSSLIGNGSFVIPSGSGIVKIPLTGVQTSGLKNGAVFKLQFVQAGAPGNPNVSIGAVQFEADPSGAGKANAFEFRPLALEIVVCQRYFETSYDIGVAAGAVASSSYARTVEQTTSSASLQCPFRMKKRATPTIVLYGPVTGATGKMAAAGAEVSAIAANANTSGFMLAVNGVSVAAGATISSHWTASAEL